MTKPRPSTSVSAVSARSVLDAVLETSEDAIFSQDASARVMTWNLTAERLFGFSAEEIVGRECVDVFADHLRREVEGVIETALAGDRVDHFETEVLRKDGMPVPISLSLCPVLGDDGAPAAVVLIARDITEQRLAQASLAEVEARVRESEALANVGSWLWDLRTGAVQWSDEYHRIHGVDPLSFDGTLDAHLAGHPRRRPERGARRDGGVGRVRPRVRARVPRCPTGPRRPYRPRAWSTDVRVGWVCRGTARHRPGHHRSGLADGLGISGEEMSHAVDEIGRLFCRRSWCVHH